MIPTYCEYINRFVAHPDFHKSAVARRYRPGEHHFVAAYLVPKLYALNKPVPDYINPDGTKGIFGDIVYFAGGKHHFGIEAKLGTIRLTSGEFNKWVALDDQSAHPDVFIGVGTRGIALTDWSDFRTAYIAAVRQAKGKQSWVPEAIPAGQYGPLKEVDLLRPHLRRSSWFAVPSDEKHFEDFEARFTRALSRLLQPLGSRAER